MQKILRINILARNQALKKARANALKEHKKEWREHDFAKLQADRARNRYIKEERTARREDWILGPLAPDRNSGKNKGVYGAVEPVMVRGPSLPTRVRKGPSGNGWDIQGSEGKPDEGKEWEGVGQEGNIVVGDRVCVVKGRDEIRGRIGVVKDVSLERGEVTVEGLNHADLKIPRTAPRPPSQKEKFSTLELPLPFDAVRLVARITDDETGFDRDVIVRYLRGGAPYYQREYGSNLPRHTRYIAGEEIMIPWPEEQFTDHELGDFDTTRRDVEEVTHTPSVLSGPPLPPGVIDELRDKFSKTRLLHDPEWVATKVVEDARSAWWESRKLQSPLEELHEMKREQSRQQNEARKQAGPSEETLQIIKQTQATTWGGHERARKVQRVDG